MSCMLYVENVMLCYAMLCYVMHLNIIHTICKYANYRDDDKLLTFSQTTNFRLFQTERLCKRQFRI